MWYGARMKNFASHIAPVFSSESAAAVARACWAEQCCEATTAAPESAAAQSSESYLYNRY